LNKERDHDGGVLYLSEEVDNHDGVVRSCARIVDDIEVDKLLDFDIWNLETFNDGLEERTDIFSYSHMSDDLLDGLLLLFGFRGVEVFVQLI
jgi:hypothetical protein